MKLSDGSERKIGVVLSYCTFFLSTIISLVYTPLLLEKLGQSEYGVYTLVSSTASYLTLLSLGFGSAYVRYFALIKKEQDREKEAQFNGLYLVLFSIMGVIAFLLGILLVAKSNILFKALSYQEMELAKKLLLILVISMAVSFPLSVFDAIITANEKFVFQKFVILIGRVLNPCLVMVLLFLGYRSIAITMITLTLTIIKGVMSLYYVKRIIKAHFSFVCMPFHLLRSIAGYSVFIFIVMISDQVNWNLDKYLLGAFVGSIEIAIYGVAAQLNSYVLSLGDIVANIFTPKIHKLSVIENNDGEIMKLLVRIGRIQFFIVMLIFWGYCFLGKQFILLWAGPEYGNSYLIGLVLIFGLTLPLMEAPTSEVLRAKGLHKQYSSIVVLGTILNLIISIVLCQRYGAMGCAIGTTLSLFITSWVIRNVYIRKKTNLDIISLLKVLLSLFLKTSPIPILCGAAIKMFATIDSYFTFFVFGVIFVVVCLLSYYFIGFNSEEKTMVKNIALKVLKR